MSPVSRRRGPTGQPPAAPVDAALITHLVDTTGLSEADAERVVDDVVGFYAEQVGDFVRRRHRALRTYGVRNEESYERIATEAAGRVFAAPALTARQIRRLIYG